MRSKRIFSSVASFLYPKAHKKNHAAPMIQIAKPSARTGNPAPLANPAIAC
jgi:hypothetical protein